MESVTPVTEDPVIEDLKARVRRLEAELAHYRELLAHIRDRRARATNSPAVATPYRNAMGGLNDRS